MLAMLAGFIAWYSLGAIPSCAHFDINGFCAELVADSNNEEINGLQANCFRLAEVSGQLCDFTFRLGIGSLMLGITTLILSVKEIIRANVANNWGDENS